MWRHKSAEPRLSLIYHASPVPSYNNILTTNSDVRERDREKGSNLRGQGDLVIQIVYTTFLALHMRLA